MGAQNLTTNIIINAKTGTGFGQVGATLTEMGEIVNGISQQLIDFGEDSINVYRKYELSMRDAEVALSTTYGRGTQQLRTVMSQLDTAATTWAASTIFHTDDVANAISEAAHAGWDYEQIMAGIPAAMQLAQAGSLDLSESVNYIVKATNAAGLGFEDLGHFIDIWSFAANSSASTIGEFGDAMLRMGSTMRFAANPEELMTLIAVTANAGAVGSEAGTMIRNSIMRLVAPTDKANKALAQLGATSIETAGLMEDEALAAANATLASHGFSVYDSSGNLRNVLDIYHDLYYALGDIAGGYDNLGRNQDVLSILSAIFPTRTITEALNLINAAAEGYDGLYEAMMGGDAAGYGEYAAETMMDSLEGDIVTFESKVERLKQLVGEELKPLVETATEIGGGLIDKLSTLDPGTFDAIVNSLTTVAAVGPGLLVAGAAFRLIGLALTPVGAAALGLTALAAAATAMKSLSETRFADNFGNMQLDSETILGYVSGITEGFQSAYTEVDKFATAMDTAVTNYQTASSTFSSTLLTDMLTGMQLTEADKTKLENLGNEMFLAVQEAIATSTAASMTYWQALFGGDGTAEFDPAYQEIIDLTNQAYEEAMAQAEEIGQGMRNALSSAFADGQISEDEYQQILSYMQSYNDAIARAAAEARSEEDYIKMQKWLHQAQTASWEEIEGISTAAAAERDAYIAELEDQYLTERYKLQYRGADEATLAAADARYQETKDAVYAAYAGFFNDLYGSQREQQTLSAYDDARVLAAQQAALGGQEGVESAARGYEASGNAEAAAQLQEFVDSFTASGITSTGTVWWNPLTWFKGYETAADQTQLIDAIGYAQMGGNYTPVAQQEAQVEFWSNFFGKASAYMAEQDRIAAENPYAMFPEVAANNQAYTVPITPEVSTSDLSDMPPVPVTGDLTELQAQVGALEEETTAKVLGDTNPLQEEVAALEEETTALVNGDTDPLKAAIDAYQGYPVSVSVSGSVSIGATRGSGGASGGATGGGITGWLKSLFAEGGRATEASIFGEAGPEWAIPEEHSENTAALLNAARAASGFTWPDLLSRFGGMNSNANNQPTTVIYSPVVHAADARGVEEVLREDKQRLEKWWEEHKMRDAMEVYA